MVYTGSASGPGLVHIRERARRMGASFIDAREVPFMTCECGQVLDFKLEESLIVQ